MRKDGAVERLATGGLVLGLFENVAVRRGLDRLRRGDTLVAYSDGVTETWNPEDEEFGEEKLWSRSWSRAARSAPGRLQDTILRELERFEAGARATDDRTLVVLKRVEAS